MKNKPSLRKREEIEIEYWKKSPTENPYQFSVRNLQNKLKETVILKNKIKYYNNYFQKSSKILEIGAGQGWASCILKIKFPSKKIIMSDISEYAVQSLKYWEKHYGIKVDQSIVCNSSKLPFNNGSLDLIYCFSSAHHFGKMLETLQEIRRVLKKGGICLFLCEPTCKKYLYKIALWRVNKIRPYVWEDILHVDEMIKYGKSAGFKNIQVNFIPDLSNKNVIKKIYYFILSKMTFLQYILPSSVDYIFEK